MNLRKRLLFLPSAIVAVLLHNIIHEGIHYGAARLFREPVLEFRLLTNGWGTSQVIFATPVAERSGGHWLVIAWAPGLVTVLIGYGIYLSRRRWWGRHRLLNSLIWYGATLFLCLDPFHFAVLSLLVGGDVNAVAAVGWPAWPVRLFALVVLGLNLWLMVRWWRQAKPRPQGEADVSGA